MFDSTNELRSYTKCISLNRSGFVEAKSLIPSFLIIFIMIQLNWNGQISFTYRCVATFNGARFAMQWELSSKCIFCSIVFVQYCRWFWVVWQQSETTIKIHYKQSVKSVYWKTMSLIFSSVRAAVQLAKTFGSTVDTLCINIIIVIFRIG